MKKWTLRELEEEGYEIKNAIIIKADLTTQNHCSLDMPLVLDGYGWGVTYGGYCLGKGNTSYKLEDIEGSKKGLEYILYIMNILGVNNFSDLQGSYVRVATRGFGETVSIIGNVLEDKWFDAKSFFKEDKDAE